MSKHIKIEDFRSPGFLFPFSLALLIVGLSTNWTFNLFAPQFLWKAYNYYFLSIVRGSLDVPVEAIGREGGYFNGKAYMYYGMLPALARVLLYPFLDLTQTPTSLFFVMLFTFLGLGILQRQINRVLLSSSTSLFSSSSINWFTVTLVTWLGSATFVISQNGTIYHEPYAASLCLFNVYLATLIKDRFFQEGKGSHSTILYALIAALAIHTRMPTALALYLVTGLILLVVTYKTNKASQKNLFRIPLIAIKNHPLSIVVLFLGGLSILILNWLKYDNPFSFMGGNYGYFFFEGFTERRCDLIPTGEFSSVLRAIANGYIYLTGDWERHGSLIRLFETGYGRWELPVEPLGLLWLLPLTFFVITIFKLVSKGLHTTYLMLLLGLLLMSAGALFQLVYPTIAHRYIAELWPPLGVSFVWCMYTFKDSLKRVFLTWCIFLLSLIGIAFQLKLAVSDKYYLEDGPVYKAPSFHYSDEDHTFLKSLTPESIKEHRLAEKKKKQEACEILEKSL